MKLYFALIGAVTALALFVAFESWTSEGSRGRNPKMSPLVYNATNADLQWLNLNSSFQKAVDSGELLRKKPTRIMREREPGDTTLTRKLMIVDVEPSEIDTVLRWFSSRPESKLAQPFRVRFYETKSVSGDGIQTIDTLRRLVFENGKFVEKPKHDDAPLQGAPPAKS